MDDQPDRLKIRKEGVMPTWTYQVEAPRGWRTVAVGLDKADVQTITNNRAAFVRRESGAYPLPAIRFVLETD